MPEGSGFHESRSFKWALICLFLVAMFAGALGNSARSLWDTSETRYAEAAREMVASGDWLVPRISGKPHLTKPPITYWAIAASMQFLGKSEFAVRFPMVLAYAATVVLTGILGRVLSGSVRTGVIAGILQLIAPMPFMGSYVVTTDIVVAMFVVAYVLGFWRATTAEGIRTRRRAAIAMYTMVALAFLTKGPPALLPALALALFAITSRKSLRLRTLAQPLGLFILLLGSLSWYLVVLLRVPEAVVVWRQEAIAKVAISSNRNMNPLMYVIYLVGGALPAVLALGYAVAHNRERIHAMFAELRLPCMLALIWILLPLTVFMSSRTRLPLYIQPLMPAVSLLAAMLAVTADQWMPHSRRVLGMRALVFLALLVASKYFITWHGDPSKDMKPLANAIQRDAAKLNSRPTLYIAMPVMGTGLEFYLDGPPVVRGRDLGNGRVQRLARDFQKVVPASRREYVVLETSDVKKYHGLFDKYVETIYENSHWTVWRRLDQNPIAVNGLAVPISRNRDT